MTGNERDPTELEADRLADLYVGPVGSPKPRNTPMESDEQKRILDQQFDLLPQTPIGAIMKGPQTQVNVPNPLIVGPSDFSNHFQNVALSDSECNVRYTTNLNQKTFSDSVIVSPFHNSENTGFYVAPVAETRAGALHGRPILDADELASLEAGESTSGKRYVGRAFDAGKRMFGNRKALAGLAAIVAIGTGIFGASKSLRSEKMVYNNTMHGAPVTYSENVGLSNSNVMRIHDDNNDKDVSNDIVYTYVDEDGANLNFSEGNDPLVKGNIEKLTVLYQGKATTFDSDSIRTPEEVELFRVHNQLYNLALDNVVAEHNRPEETRRSYILDRSKSLLERFQGQPAYKPQPKGPPAD